ncbi:MAG: hypothetical protein CMP07_09315 [Xanthomonadales bacterium]|nr:hypothetical protein [Xanthomonadales bacterium]|tara:strand:- start:1119 stop:2339 length:1221 start_codon:yes stop_codon:yes gene_type:complete
MHLLITEPAPGGHHLSAYSRYLIREACRRGWLPVLVTSPQAQGHRALEMLVDEFGDRLGVLEGPPVSLEQVEGVWGLVARQLRFFGWHKKAVAQARKFTALDVVMVMSFDSIDRVAALVGPPTGSLPAACLSVGVRYHWPGFGLAAKRRRDFVDRKLFERAISATQLKALFVIDELYAEYASRAGGDLAAKVALVPDPGEVTNLTNKAASRESLGIAQDALVILVYGGISERKGIELLIQAVADIDVSRKIVILLAGECGEDAHGILGRESSRALVARGGLRVRDFFHDRQQEGEVFSAADFVWVAYSPRFLKRSAVMSQAAQAGLPCIATAGGLIARIVTAHGLGPVLSGHDKQELIELLYKLASDAELLGYWSENARAYGQACSGEVFGAAVCDRLALIHSHAS